MHLTDDELVLHYYGEMSDEAESRACAHLESCAECRHQLGQLQRVMTAIDASSVPEPDAWFEKRMWQRLKPQLAAPVPSRRFAILRMDRIFRLRPEAAGNRFTAGQAIAWGAAAALVIIGAFVAGRVTPPAPVPTQTAAVEQPVREKVLLVDLGDHLDRSENALVEFVSGTDGRDVSAGRSRAEDLVAANRLYRRTAATSGDTTVADVLDELERVLIEIAGTRPEASTDDLDTVRQRIDSRGLLFKLRIMREGLQDRARDTRDTQKVKGQDTTL